jgi:catechol 2,3-dioxygenase-like lactoylglutathione lyase family enzyme
MMSRTSSALLALLFVSGCSGGQANGPAASVPADDRRSHLVLEGTEMTTVSVRYIVNDVDAAIAFYTELLQFQVEQHPAPGFASLSRGNLRLLLNKPGAGGAGQAMPDGRNPEPGGWNRIQLEVPDLERKVAALREAGARFRNDIVIGNGGKQILVEDPSGNPIELFEPPPKR